MFPLDTVVVCSQLQVKRNIAWEDSVDGSAILVLLWFSHSRWFADCTPSFIQWMPAVRLPAQCCSPLQGSQGEWGQMGRRCLQLLPEGSPLGWWGSGRRDCPPGQPPSMGTAVKASADSQQLAGTAEGPPALAFVGSQSNPHSTWLYPHFTPLLVSVFGKKNTFPWAHSLDMRLPHHFRGAPVHSPTSFF